MSRGGGFGFSAEIAAQREMALNSVDGQARVQEAVAWIEALTGQPLSAPGDLQASLKDGLALCELLNACVPGTIPDKKINRSTMPFKQMENITSFLRACRTLGVPEPDLFETVRAPYQPSPLCFLKERQRPLIYSSIAPYSGFP